MIGSDLKERFRISAPTLDDVSDMDWDAFRTATLIATECQHSFCFETINDFSRNGESYSFIGKILFLKNESGVDHAAVFLCSPNVNTLEDLYDQRVSIKDLKGKDNSRLQMLLNQANMKHFQESSTEVNSALHSSCL